jgi:sulfur carrier protein
MGAIPMIRVNDKFEVEWEEGMTVTELLKRLRFSFPLIIVSVDGELVPKEEYATRMIQDDAKVKVLHMTAGG